MLLLFKKIENNLSGLDASRVNVYNRDVIIKDKIASITLKDAVKLGIPRRTFYRLKKNIKNSHNLEIRLKTKIKIT